MHGKIALILIFFFGLAPPVGAWTGTVVSVIDANTIRVNLEYGGTIEVGFYGIAAPEPDQPFGREAVQAATIQVFGKVVEMEFVNTRIADPGLNSALYGISFAIVWVGDRVVNEELIRSGMVWVDPYCFKPFCRDWGLLEYEAAEARRGLWMDPNPIPPWEWRRRSSLFYD